MRIGIIYNNKKEMIIKKGIQNPEVIDDETILAVKKALEKHYDVTLIDVGNNFFDDIKHSYIDLAFNLSYGLQGESRQSQVPAMLEMAGIPYTGSDPLGHAIALDKPLTKKLLEKEGILTPKYEVLHNTLQVLNKKLRYPLVVKPSCGSLHEGIKVASSEEMVMKWAEHVIQTYNQAALIEEYAACEEYTACVLGNRNPEVLPILHIRPRTKSTTPILKKGTKNDKTCPAKLTRKQEHDIKIAVLRSYKATMMKDLARMDLKLMDDGKVNILEVNSNPGLHPKWSLLPRIARAYGISYDDLINKIVSITRQRYGI